MVLIVRFERPAWSTGTLIPASFLCGIASAVFIWKGGQKTKRTEEVRERLRLALKIEQNPGDFLIVDAGTRTADEQPDAENHDRGSDSSNTSNASEGRALEKKTVEEDTITRDDESSAVVDEKMDIPADAAHRR